MSTVKRIELALLGLALTGLTAVASAANVQSTVAATISSVDIYTSYGSGDAIVHLTSNSLSSFCPYGFWISGADAGGKSALAQMIAAHSVGGSVVIAADTTTFWPGNANTHACQIWSVTAQ